MKNIKRLSVASIFSLAFAASVLTGCGGNKSNALVIKFWHTFGDTVEKAIQDKTDAFCELVKKNENVDVKVELEYKGGYSDIKNQVEMGLSSGDAPTIAVAYPDHVADYIKKQGDTAEKYVVNLQNFIDNPKTTFGTDEYLGDTNPEILDFHETTLHEGKNYVIDGMYSLTLMRSTEAMIYNETLVNAFLEEINNEFYFPKYGQFLETGKVNEYFTEKCTFSDLMKIAEVLYKHRADQGRETAIEWPILYDSDGNMFITDLIQNNVGYSSVIEGQKRGQIDFKTGENRTKAEQLVTEIKQNYDKHLVATKGSMGEYSSNYFKQGKAVFVIGSTGGSGYTFPEEGSFAVAASRVPTFGEISARKYVTQGVNLTLLTYPERARADELKLYGWKLLKYLTSTAVNVDLCVSGSEGYMPVRKTCLETTKWQSFLKNGSNYAKVAAVVNAIPDNGYLYTPSFPGSATLRNQVGGIITTVLKNDTNVTEAFTAAINNAELDM